MRIAQLSLLCLMALLCCLGCQKRHPQTEEEVRIPQCHEAWIYAPSSLVLDLASGNDVIVNPAVHTFPLFCSSKEAKEGLAQAIDKGTLPKGQWSVYLLAGDMQKLASPSSTPPILQTMTQIVSWEKIED